MLVTLLTVEVEIRIKNSWNLLTETKRLQIREDWCKWSGDQGFMLRFKSLSPLVQKMFLSSQEDLPVLWELSE